MEIPFASLGKPGDSVDVCVIGTGAAGLPIAARLAERGHRVVLCEGGDIEFSERSQSLYRGTVVGGAYVPLDTARLRYLGGSTNHWGGVCRPLDPYDFAAKPATAETRWPIEHSELVPYYGEAAQILDVLPIGPDSELPGSGLRRIHFSIGESVHTRTRYASTIRDSPRLAFCSAANLMGLETRDGRITSARFTNYEGGVRDVHARFYVLACGGIENSRLLLWSNRQSGGRLIRNADTLGRYWMDHPHASIGQALLFDPAPLGLDRAYDAFFAPTPHAMIARNILNCGLRLHTMGPEQNLALTEDLTSLSPSLKQRIQTMQASGVAPKGIILRAAWEQEPRRENRIELDDTRLDSLGMPRCRLSWGYSSLDVRTLRESVLMLGDYLRQTDIGRLKLADWLTQEPILPPDTGELVGRHHMGGTRMAASASQGIVDLDCRVFDQDNLYIGGSSVFPGCGHANPTLTIVQLAMRMADHLDARLLRQTIV
ncbi:FAD-dependent oxidoreductase [Litchfieldella xinjiangensis]|uniref:FAD-dependent oxidoreductase n=1 Tax=Litchfieldella xinjiangensis TaxID=1166948 RepID=UPI0005B80F44|nr:GMC family oxidoreductase [Halomonas xinjiangensis]